MSNGQYKSIFGETQTSWNIRHKQLGGDLLDSLTITGDTIFNNLSWKKGVYHSHLLEGYSCYIAEDTTTGEIWYSKNIDTNYNSSQNFFYTTKKKYLPFASQIFNYTL